MFIRVDFPAPFSPSRAWISPRRTANSMPLLATTPGNRLTIPRISTAGAAPLPSRTVIVSISACSLSPLDGRRSQGAEVALIRIGGDDPMPLAQLLGGVERPDAGRTGHREGDVDTLVVLSKGQLLSQRRVLEGVGVGDHDIDVRIDRLRAGLEADDVAHPRRDLSPTNDTKLVALGHQSGQHAAEERPL